MELYNEKTREASARYIYEPTSFSPHFSTGIEAVSGCVMLTTLNKCTFFKINKHECFVERFYLSYILSMHCIKVVFEGNTDLHRIFFSQSKSSILYESKIEIFITFDSAFKLNYIFR